MMHGQQNVKLCEDVAWIVAIENHEI